MKAVEAKAEEAAGAAAADLAQAIQLANARADSEEALRRQITTLNTDVANAQAEGREKGKEVERLVSELRRRSGRMSGELIELQQAAVTRKNETTQLRKSLRETEGKLKSTTSELTIVKSTVDAATAEAKAAKETMEVAVTAKREAEAERLVARQRIAELEGAMERAMKAEGALKVAAEEAAKAKAEAERLAEAAGLAALERTQMRKKLEELQQEDGKAYGRHLLGSPPRATPPKAVTEASPTEQRAVNEVLTEAYARVQQLEADLDKERSERAAEGVDQMKKAVVEAERRAEVIALQFKRYVELNEERV